MGHWWHFNYEVLWDVFWFKKEGSTLQIFSLCNFNIFANLARIMDGCGYSQNLMDYSWKIKLPTANCNGEFLLVYNFIVVDYLFLINFSISGKSSSCNGNDGSL